MNVLLVFPSDYDFAHLQAYFRQQEMDTVIYPDFKTLENFQVIVVFTPLHHQDKLLNPLNVWRQYLDKQMALSEITLIPTGVLGNKHPAYLDLLQLPEDFTGMLSERYSDPDIWQEPVITEGTDINTLLLKLYLGHNSSSLLPPLANVRRKLKLLEFKLQKRQTFAAALKAMISDEVPDFLPKNWQELCSRWLPIVEQLKHLPFPGKIEEIRGLIAAISPFFMPGGNKEKQYYDLNIMQQFSTLYDSLAYIRTYVKI